MDHEIFARSGSEEKVEEATSQSQRLVRIFGNKDVAVDRNTTLDPEHWTLKCLVLRDLLMDNRVAFSKSFNSLSAYLNPFNPKFPHAYISILKPS